MSSVRVRLGTQGNPRKASTYGDCCLGQSECRTCQRSCGAMYRLMQSVVSAVAGRCIGLCGAMYRLMQGAVSAVAKLGKCQDKFRGWGSRCIQRVHPACLLHCQPIVDVHFRNAEGGLTPRGHENAACGDGNFRVRRWSSPRAALAISAGGVLRVAFGIVRDVKKKAASLGVPSSLPHIIYSSIKGFTSC